jgi:hypothetical protein
LSILSLFLSSSLSGIKPLTCIQTAGDVMIIPESWGHGVLNLQESIAIATEAKVKISILLLFSSYPIHCLIITKFITSIHFGE